MRRLWKVLAALLVLVFAACAPRQAVIQVPTYEVQGIRFARLDLVGQSLSPQAVLNINLLVHNPNGFGLRMANIGGRLYLDGSDVGGVDLPDVDLPASGDARQLAIVTVPVNLGNLVEFGKVAAGGSVALRVDGRFTVNAGILGRPVFGPYTLFQGQIRNRALVK